MENERKQRERLERERLERERLERERLERERLEREKNRNKRFNNLQKYTFVKQNIVELIRAVSKGPVVVAQYVSEQFKFYSNGIFDGEGCNSTRANHTSLIVGYDLNDKNPYFLAKNSWGELWGDKGYYKILIGSIGTDQKGLCLLAATNFNVQPILN